MVLTSILNFCFDTFDTRQPSVHGEIGHRKLGHASRAFLPSNIRTAVGKSLTLLAALKAAVMTEGDGTRSYANALFRFRCEREGIC